MVWASIYSTVLQDFQHHPAMEDDMERVVIASIFGIVVLIGYFGSIFLAAYVIFSSFLSVLTAQLIYTLILQQSYTPSLNLLSVLIMFGIGIDVKFYIHSIYYQGTKIKYYK